MALVVRLLPAVLVALLFAPVLAPAAASGSPGQAGPVRLAADVVAPPAGGPALPSAEGGPASGTAGAPTRHHHHWSDDWDYDYYEYSDNDHNRYERNGDSGLLVLDL